MESYLKHYKMKLKTLAPLYIGSGKEVTKKQYIFANNKIYVIDVPKFLKFIALELSSQMQRYIKINFKRRFPVQAFAWTLI